MQAYFNQSTGDISFLSRKGRILEASTPTSNANEGNGVGVTLEGITVTVYRDRRSSIEVQEGK